MKQTIPSVDLGSSTVAHKLDDAFSSLGFVQLVGHGLSVAAANSLRAGCDEFFALPDDDKRRFAVDDPVANRGYRAKGSESLSYSLGAASPPDLFESFNCAADDRVSDSPLQQPTPWPSARFADSAHGYLNEMEALSSRIDELIAGVIGLDELPARSGRGPDTLACINYEPGADGTEPAVPNQQRMGAHSDYTTFTILDADPVPGLQIIGSSGDWIDVIPDPEALLVNVGDVLAMYTNDAWPSTLHRVVPMAAGSSPRRRSVAYFHYPDLDVVVEPLPGYVAEDEPPRYLPTTVADHLLGKLTAPKLREPASGISTVAGRRIT